MDLIHLAEFAHMHSHSFTRTQLRAIDRLCEQANQYHHSNDDDDEEMCLH